MSGTVTVSANPVPTITGSIYTVAPTGTISLSGSVSGGLWTSSSTGVATIGSSSGIVTGVALGSSTISYTLPTGCRGTRVIYVTPTGHRGISDDSSTSALFARRVYVRPNPNSGAFWVSGDFGTETEATLEVFNMLGQKIYSRVVRLEDGKLYEEILLENIANGTYLLNVSSATYRDMFHIVVTR